MLTDPLTLFDQTIDNLETLAALLADEFDERVRSLEAERGGTLLYRSVHSKIGLLLPALRAARSAQEQATRIVQRPYCLNCD